MNKRVFEASLIVTGLALAALAPVSRSQAVPTAHHACLDEERQAIENGEGFGMALAADRNGYPGPKHILELREQLGLTPAQQAQAQQLFDRMRADALAAGRKLLDKESELERHFASGAADTARVRRLWKRAPACEPSCAGCTCPLTSPPATCSPPSSAPATTRCATAPPSTPTSAVPTFSAYGGGRSCSEITVTSCCGHLGPIVGTALATATPRGVLC